MSLGLTGFSITLSVKHEFYSTRNTDNTRRNFIV